IEVAALGGRAQQRLIHCHRSAHPRDRDNALPALLRLVTRADFAYTAPRSVLLYADGLEFHSSLRQRIHDTRQSNLLQAEGWAVIRFLGPQILGCFAPLLVRCTSGGERHS